MADYEEMDDTIIETVDENGNVIKFELIDIIELDEIEYGILYPIDENENENDDEEIEVLVMRLKKENEEFIFEAIDDDAEFQKVVDYVNSIKEEI